MEALGTRSWKDREMAWRMLGTDRKVEVVVDPMFSGDLMEIAVKRPVWIVETETTKPLIDATWERGSLMNLCEVNRCSLVSTSPEDCLLGLIPTLHSHYNWSVPRWEGLVVHGAKDSLSLRSALADWGFVVSDALPDGFEATVPEQNWGLWDFSGKGDSDDSGQPDVSPPRA